MICERAKEQMASYLAGDLEGPGREKFVDHLESCDACRREVEELGALWRGLELLPRENPSRELRTRFTEMLDAYQFGLQQGRVKPAKRWLWWPLSPQWQLAGAAALLLLSFFAGRSTGPAEATRPEISQLKGEVESMRQLVTLSLLQQQSPSARLRGVTYSYQMERPDPQVEQALLYAVNHDGNVNVRLSAVDALQKYVRRPEVGQALIDALPAQDSPLVQIALIDALVQANDDAVIPVLRKLTNDPQVNASTRQRAAWGLRRLGVS